MLRQPPALNPPALCGLPLPWDPLLASLSFYIQEERGGLKVAQSGLSNRSHLRGLNIKDVSSRLKNGYDRKKGKEKNLH